MRCAVCGAPATTFVTLTRDGKSVAPAVGYCGREHYLADTDDRRAKVA